MFESNLLDLDELVLMVRDRNSRTYIGEAITTYRGRAYRSALLATWIAVAYDIISKIRELELQGDAAAGAFVTVLDNAIDAKERGDPRAVQRLQVIENELLEKALKEFEFLSAPQHEDLNRLRNDRNQCAHPAFISDSTLFEPSAELVRSHLAHAVLHLLRHPPIQGRHALKRLMDDLLLPSFPSTQKSISDFLESRYLNHAKTALVESLVKVFLKIILKQSEPALIGKEELVLMCLVAVGRRHEAIYEQEMAAQLPLLTDHSDEVEMKRAFRLFRWDQRCWGWLSQPTRLRIGQIATNYAYDAADFDSVVHALEIDELKPVLLARIDTFSAADKQQIFARYHRPEFVEQAIGLFATAGSYRSAESMERAMLLPLCSVLRVENVQRILLVAQQNGQIRMAAGTPAFMVELFDRTADLHDQTRPAWQHFLGHCVSRTRARGVVRLSRIATTNGRGRHVASSSMTAE